MLKVGQVFMKTLNGSNWNNPNVFLIIEKVSKCGYSIQCKTYRIDDNGVLIPCEKLNFRKGERIRKDFFNSKNYHEVKYIDFMEVNQCLI